MPSKSSATDHRGDDRQGGARDRFRSGDALFAVVDVGLPDGRGDALALELRELRADLPIILATGYDGAHLDERARAVRSWPC